MARLDPHSYVDSDQTPPRTRLALTVGPDRRLLHGTATFFVLATPALDLDTKGLTVHDARTEAGASVPFEVGPEENCSASACAWRRPRAPAR